MVRKLIARIGMVSSLVLIAAVLAMGCARDKPVQPAENAAGSMKPRKIFQTLGVKGEKKEENKEEATAEKKEEEKEEAAAEEKAEEDEGEDEEEGVKEARDKTEKMGEKAAGAAGKTKGHKVSRLSRDRLTARVSQPRDGNPDVHRAVRRRMSAFRNCFAQLLARDRNMKGGDVKVRFTIGREGQVLSSSIEQNETGSAALEECMLKKLKGVRFPRQDADLEQSLVMSFRNSGNIGEQPGDPQ